MTTTIKFIKDGRVVQTTTQTIKTRIRATLQEGKNLKMDFIRIHVTYDRQNDYWNEVDCRPEDALAAWQTLTEKDLVKEFGG
jgi:hypothetical protein